MQCEDKETQVRDDLLSVKKINGVFRRNKRRSTIICDNFPKAYESLNSRWTWGRLRSIFSSSRLLCSPINYLIYNRIKLSADTEMTQSYYHLISIRAELSDAVCVFNPVSARSCKMGQNDLYLEYFHVDNMWSKTPGRTNFKNIKSIFGWSIIIMRTIWVAFRPLSITSIGGRDADMKNEHAKNNVNSVYANTFDVASIFQILESR